jgi:hypothetical protein
MIFNPLKILLLQLLSSIIVGSCHRTAIEEINLWLKHASLNRKKVYWRTREIVSARPNNPILTICKWQ